MTDSPTPSNDDLLTREQAAEYLQVSVRNLDRWHAKRYGPPRCKIGRLVRYRKSSIDRWIDASEITPVRSCG